MPRYLVNGEVTVSAYTYVEADSPEEAWKIAANREGEVAQYGAERSGVDDWEVFVVESADGMFRVTSVEETQDTNPNAEDDE